MIATGGTELSESERESGDRIFSPFSRVILDIAGGVTSELGDFGRENTPIVDNPVFSDASELGSANDAGDTFETAQQLSFQRGDTSGADISFVEADLDGGANDVDVFSFTTNLETTFSSHVLSEELRFSREFDPALVLFDSSGTAIASSDDISYGGDSIDVDTIAGLSNSSTSDDSFLFNIVLSPGTYYLEVRATDVDISDFPLSGDQYFLVTSLVPSDFLLGDTDLNGVVDFFDIAPFIGILSAEGFQAEADIDQNGEVNFFDISPFIAILAG